MAFPTIADADTKNGTVTSNSTSWTITYPTNIAAGDLLLLFIGSDGTTDFSAPGFTLLATVQLASPVSLGLLGKVAAGTETGTFTATASATEQGSWRIFRIPAAGWFGGTLPTWTGGQTDGDGISLNVSGATTGNPDPPNLDPANWATEDVLWIAACAIDTSRTISAYPLAGRNTADVSGGSTGATLGLCTTTSTAGSLNPTTFTASASDDWEALTVAIRPAASGGLTQSPSDSVNNLADAQGLGYGNLHSDSVNNLADTVALAMGHLITASDNANNLADGSVRVIGILNPAQDSLQALTDALAQLLSYQLLFADSEAANWADSHNLLLSQFLALADSSLLSDAALVNLDYRTQPTDTLNSLTDSLEQHLGVAHELADDLNTFDDSFAALLAYDLDLSDSSLTFPSTPILDDFNRADEGPEPSANWTFAGLIDSPQGFAVVGNRMAAIDQSGENSDYWNVEDFGPDCEAYITVADGTDLIDLFLAVRLADSGPTTAAGYVAQILASGSQGANRAYLIRRLDSGSLVTIASTIETGVGSFTGDRYGIRVLGNVIELWADLGSGWTLKLSTTDNTYTTTGKIAFYAESGSPDLTRYDDFGGGTVRGGLADNFSLTLATGPSIALELSDAIALTDSLAIGLGLQLTETGITLTDAPILRADELLAFNDSISLTDSESHVLDLQLTFTETIALNDSLTLAHGLICADSFTFSDALAIQMGQSLTASDLLSLTDSESHLLDWRASFTDDINLLVDSVALRLSQLLDLADFLPTLTDARALELSYRLSFSDVISLTDDYADDLINTVEGTTEELADDIDLLNDQLTLGVGLVVSDNAATLIDTESHLLDQSVALTDSIPAFNDAIELRLDYALDFSDLLTLADSESAQLDQRQPLADSLASLDDAVVVQLGQRLSFNESIDDLADSYAQTAAELLSFLDTLALTDSTQLGYGLSITDDIDLLIDSIATSAPQGPLRQVGVTDSVESLADSFALRLDYLLAVADTTSLSDSLALNEGLFAAFADTLSLTDAITSTLGHLAPLVDALTLNDSVQLRLGYELPLADVVALADSAILSLSYLLALTDNALLLADSALKSLGLTLIITDNAPTLTDTISLFSAWLLQLSDSFTLTDSLTKSGEGFLALEDSLTITDSVAIELRGPDLDESVSDTLALTDAITLTLNNELQLRLAISDLLTLTDHYFDLRHPYTPSTKRHIVVPSRARTTTPTRQREVIVPASSRTAKVD